MHGELDGEADEATLGVFDEEVACEAVGEPLRVAACDVVALPVWLNVGICDCVAHWLRVDDSDGEIDELGVALPLPVEI